MTIWLMNNADNDTLLDFPAFCLPTKVHVSLAKCMQAKLVAKQPQNQIENSIYTQACFLNSRVSNEFLCQNAMRQMKWDSIQSYQACWLLDQLRQYRKLRFADD